MLEFNRELLVNAQILRRELISSFLNPGLDINYECRYPETISIEDYKRMYDREGIGTRVVNVLPQDSWALDPEIYETENSDETEFEKKWKELVETKFIFHYLQRADEQSGIGRFGILLLGLSDGQDLSQEVTPKDGMELLYLKPFDESVVQIKNRESSTDNPRYGYPTIYSIDFETSTGAGSVSQKKEVHWTRIIHLADNRGVSEVFGAPRMKPVYNRLLDIRKVVSGSGEMFWRGAYPGHAFEVDPERKTALTDTEKTSIRDEFKAYSEGLQRYIAVSGMKVKSLPPQVEDPTGHLEAQLKFIALTLGIPYRVFIGTEEAKLASSQDIKTYNKRLSKRRDKYISPMILKPFVDRLIMVKVLPEKPYFINWPDLDAPTEEGQAEIAKTKTDAFKTYVQGDVSALIPPKEYLTIIMKMDEKEAEAIIKASEAWERENPPEPEPTTQPNEDEDND
jgi:hypothetical protein